MNDAEHQRHAASFGAAAEAYERGRPSYHDAALDWLLPIDAETVLDLGAGTGKLSRQLTARGLTTLAVEPAPEMLQQLRRAAPLVDARQGTAEKIPLPDTSVVRTRGPGLALGRPGAGGSRPELALAVRVLRYCSAESHTAASRSSSWRLISSPPR